MGANKNGQRIMCSVICTPNTGHPVLGVHIIDIEPTSRCFIFCIRVVWHTHKNGTASNWCSNWCRRSGLRSAASYCRLHNAAHLRPQVVFIRKAPPLSGSGEGLAGKAAGNDGDCFKSCLLKKYLLRKVFGTNAQPASARFVHIKGAAMLAAFLGRKYGLHAADFQGEAIWGVIWLADK